MDNYINPPFNYTGGKFKLLDQILPKFDYSKPTFIDLFTGGGSVYCNVLDKYNKILVNDIISDLIGIHKQLTLSDKIIDDVKMLCVAKDDQVGFHKLRDDYNINPTPAKLWALMLCSTNNMLRFNKSMKYNQSFGRRNFNISTEKKVNEYVSLIRPYGNKMFYTSKHFKDIPITLKAFYYIDPPYSNIINNDGQISNKKISEAGYNILYNKQDDIDLYEYIHKLNKVGATFMISGLLEHNDKKSWILTKLMQDGFNFTYIDTDYHKVSRQSEDKKSKEIIIYNY
jgi:adenine-specific DNA-methyltransferase